MIYTDRFVLLGFFSIFNLNVWWLILQLLELQEKNFQSYVCDPAKLPILITIPNDTAVTEEHISRELCRLNSTTLTKVSNTMVNELNIGSILQDVSSSWKPFIKIPWFEKYLIPLVISLKLQ